MSVSSMAYRMKRNGAGLCGRVHHRHNDPRDDLLFLVPLFRRGGRREYALPERYKHHSRGDAGADHGRQYRALPPCHRRLYVRERAFRRRTCRTTAISIPAVFLRRHGAVLVFAGGRLGLIFGAVTSISLLLRTMPPEPRECFACARDEVSADLQMLLRASYADAMDDVSPTRGALPMCETVFLPADGRWIYRAMTLIVNDTASAVQISAHITGMWLRCSINGSTISIPTSAMRSAWLSHRASCAPPARWSRSRAKTLLAECRADGSADFYGSNGALFFIGIMLHACVHARGGADPLL